MPNHPTGSVQSLPGLSLWDDVMLVPSLPRSVFRLVHMSPRNGPLSHLKSPKMTSTCHMCVMLTSSSINQMLPRALSSLDPYRLLVSHPFSYGSTSVITCHSHIAITITTIQNQLVVFGPPSSGLWHKGRVGTVILHRQSCDQKFGKIGHCTPPAH